MTRWRPGSFLATLGSKGTTAGRRRRSAARRGRGPAHRRRLRRSCARSGRCRARSGAPRGLARPSERSTRPACRRRPPPASARFAARSQRSGRRSACPPFTLVRDAPRITTSASRRAASVDDRRPRASRALEPARDLDARVGLQQRLRLVEDLIGDPASLGQLGVERLVERHLEHVEDDDPRPALRGEPRGCDERLLRLGGAQHRARGSCGTRPRARARSRARGRSGAAAGAWRLR